jgi:hypothetical protein
VLRRVDVSRRCRVQAAGQPPLHDTKHETANSFQAANHHITRVPVPHPLQGLTPSSSWSEVFSFYIITTILSFVVGTIADFTSGAAARRLPFTFIAAIIFILKLDDLSSHAYTNSPLFITVLQYVILRRSYNISWGVVFAPPFILFLMFSLYVAFLYWL